MHGMVNVPICDLSSFFRQKEDNYRVISRKPDQSVRDSLSTIADSLESPALRDITANSRHLVKVIKSKGTAMRPRHSIKALEGEDENQELKSDGLSEYEKLVKKNREEKMAFLESLRIDEAKLGFVESVKREKGATKRISVKSIKRPSVSPPLVLRKSKRLANISVDLSEEGLFEKSVRSAYEEEYQPKVLPPVLTFDEAAYDKESLKDFTSDLECLAFKNAKGNAESYEKCVSRFKHMVLDPSNIAKVVPGRITTMDVHPLVEKTIVCAATNKGDIGFWNVESNSDPYAFQCHRYFITKVQFNPFNSCQLISSSYDGTLRCGDIESKIFNQIYDISEETGCTYFDFLSATTFLVAQKNGNVAVVDVRSNSKRSEKKHRCHENPIKVVNIHPVNKNYFISAENKGTISLWDLRKLQKHSVTDIRHHKKCVHSAYFSPVTGNSILSLSSDDSICLFDSSSLDDSIRLKRSLRHNNFTGRWLSVFRAKWLPRSEENFVVGSMLHPRRIEIYNDEMENVYNFFNYEYLTSVSSVTVFHPQKSVLAGGNSSGKVFVFKDLNM